MVDMDGSSLLADSQQRRMDWSEASGYLALRMHSSNKPEELLQWLATMAVQ